MKKIFSAAIVAECSNFLRTRTQVNVMIIHGFASADDAEEYALKCAKNEILPIQKGWRNHKIIVTEVLPDIILAAGYKAE